MSRDKTEYELLEEEYDPTQRQAPCPDQDAMIIEGIEIGFAIPVTMTVDQQRRLHKLVDEITRAPWNQPKGGTHWPAFCGGRLSMSKADAALLGGRAQERVDPDIPDGEEPTCDNSVFVIETSARPFVSRKEAEKHLRRGSGRPPTA